MWFRVNSFDKVTITILTVYFSRYSYSIHTFKNNSYLSIIFDGKGKWTYDFCELRSIFPVFKDLMQGLVKGAKLCLNPYFFLLAGEVSWLQGLVKGAILCFRNLYFYFRHGESTSTASQLTSSASQKSKDLNKVSLLLQDLGQSSYP